MSKTIKWVIKIAVFLSEVLLISAFTFILKNFELAKVLFMIGVTLNGISILGLVNWIWEDEE